MKATIRVGIRLQRILDVRSMHLECSYVGNGSLLFSCGIVVATRSFSGDDRSALLRTRPCVNTVLKSRERKRELPRRIEDRFVLSSRSSELATMTRFERTIVRASRDRS